MAFLASAAPAHAAPDKDLVTDQHIAAIRSFIDQDIVRLSILNQNKKYQDIDSAGITKLDEQWVAERKAENKPLIAATLSNPLSSYLTRVQAHSTGLYTEIFVMDKNGLNVGQSNPSSDFWQGDEAKFQKTYPVGPTAIFIDDPEFNDETQTWNTQVNLAIADASGQNAIGAVTVEVNLTELQRRTNTKVTETKAPEEKAAEVKTPAPTTVETPVDAPVEAPAETSADTTEQTTGTGE